ncbi:MAG: hypothetical protein KF687_14365 [Cyclobacteriaceae bacterium]|nr:hypothetical protein [Cyclobacteriaceae bacterium]
MKNPLRLFLVFTMICFWSLSSYSQTTLSKRCGKCSKEVSINSKVGDTCPHCGVRWGYESTSTTTIPSSSTPYLDYYQSPVKSNTSSSQKKTTPVKIPPNPFKSYSKEQTERWLEDKLNQYSQKRIWCPDNNALMASPCRTYDEYECKLDGTYLIVKFNYDNKYDEVNYLTLYDFSYLSGKSYGTEINISNTSTTNNLDDWQSKRKLVNYITIGYKNDAEDSLVEKLGFAFEHLKKFYKRPVNRELPEFTSKSDLNKPSLADTKEWISSKLNTYTAKRFDIVSSCCSYTVSSPSFGFSDLFLVMQYYDISNRKVTVKIPICECYIGEVGSLSSNDFSGCNFRFYSQKENITAEDWQGRRTLDFINLKIDFHKEDDLFNRLQKAFKNLKTYCPTVTKKKETF